MARRSLTVLMAATALLTGVAAGGAAWAQGDDQKMDKKGGMGGHMGMMMGPGAMKGPEHMAAMQAARIAYLKTALGITDAQMKEWNAYVEALKANQAKMMGMTKPEMDATAIEKLDVRIARTKARLENLEAIKPATEALYDALNADQKKKADAILMRRRGMM